MKYLSVVLATLLAIASSSFAQSSLPACTLTCLTSLLPTSQCSPTDQDCICQDAALNAQLSICVQSTCALKDQLTTMNQTTIACHAPVRSKVALYKVITIVFFTLSTFSVAVRFASVFTNQKPFTPDDWVIISVLILNTTITGIALGGLVPNGLGQDIYKVPFTSITKMLYFFFIDELLYFAIVSLLKICVLLFFLRVFTSPIFRQIVWIIIFLNAIVGIGFIMTNCLICQPMSMSWDQWDHEHKGHCGDINMMAFANAGISIVLDFLMLALPISQVWQLQMGYKKKLGVALMFSVGLFVTIVSILRLKALATFAKTVNPTWDFLEAGLWSNIEINVGMICACMPNIRLVLVRIFPTILGSSARRTEGNSTNGYAKNWVHSSRDPKERDRDGKGIGYSRTYTVEHASKPRAQDESSFVQLVEMEPSR